MRSMIFPSVVLTLALPAVAAAQGVADRVTAPAAAPAQPGAFDRVLDLVLPVPATEPPHAERLGEFVMNTIGPVPLVGEAVGAALSQASNSPKEWGQGWNAYGKRFGSNLAYNGVRQTITFAGSNLLREDTRYFASRSDGFLPRARHALVSTFTARRA